jgi:hypothetical protein
MRFVTRDGPSSAGQGKTLRRIAAAAVLSLGVLGLLGLPGAPARGQQSGSLGPEGCLTWTTHARWVPYGYDHIVKLQNGCTAGARCEVSTDVTPEPQQVQVASGETASILTRRGSPARVFKANVSCDFR